MEDRRLKMGYWRCACVVGCCGEKTLRINPRWKQKCEKCGTIRP